MQFYTLFAALDVCSEVGKDRFISRTKQFVSQYKEIDFENDDVPPFYKEYRLGSISRTSGKSSRSRRIDSLVDFIKAD